MSISFKVNRLETSDSLFSNTSEEEKTSTSVSFLFDVLMNIGSFKDSRGGSIVFSESSSSVPWVSFFFV